MNRCAKWECANSAVRSQRSFDGPDLRSVETLHFEPVLQNRILDPPVVRRTIGQQQQRQNQSLGDSEQI